MALCRILQLVLKNGTGPNSVPFWGHAVKDDANLHIDNRSYLAEGIIKVKIQVGVREGGGAR